MTVTAFGTFYRTGTVTLVSGSTSVTSSGALWTDIVQGDKLEAQGFFGTVDTVTDTTLELFLPWSGAGGVDLDYVLHLESKARFDPALTQSKAREVFAQIADASVFYSVSGTEPDPAIGEDGQYALKTNTGVWQQWLKASGVWVLQATPVGVSNRGTWSSLTNYVVNDFVTRAGTVYLCNVANINKPPESNPTEWAVFGAQGDTGPAGPTGVTGGDGPAGATGASGADGKTTRYGSGAPANALGNDGDFYIDVVGQMNYGPKAAGTWPAGTSRVGPQGIQGDDGSGIQPSATGTLAERAAYDNAALGFIFMETDTAPFRLWVKASNASADWAGPSYVGGTAAVGDLGSVTDSVLETFDLGSVA
jgi:hypothetical protein